MALEPKTLEAITRLGTGARQRRKPLAKGSMVETPSGPQQAGSGPVGTQRYAPTSADRGTGTPGASAPPTSTWASTSAYTGGAPSSAPTDWTPSSAYE